MTGKSERVAAIVLRNGDRWGMADFCRFLLEDKAELKHHKTLTSKPGLDGRPLWTDEELARGREQHQRSIRLQRRRVLECARQIAAILAEDS